MANLPEFVNVYKRDGLELYFTINHRHPEWFKLCFETWYHIAKIYWRHPIFWAIVTPRIYGD